MSDKQCEVVDGEVDHDWKFVRDWSGDPRVINGTFDCSYLECRVCGEENHNASGVADYADYEY
ncbi:hypothetical protein M1B34_31805 [Pseudomonas sp. MAFF 302030]|uniref:Uncharacterized protein n=1 Tax=Pseudomonas morbosilactucae TaxID=2938197 RepID=A0A9X1Z1A1_9PSED|nr:hypothetical protein [Pseudomonas morbosilactucae]MCK9802123.1 hypothetical protein [Pseudomonas morbosilactucae]